MENKNEEKKKEETNNKINEQKKEENKKEGKAASTTDIKNKTETKKIVITNNNNTSNTNKTNTTTTYNVFEEEGEPIQSNAELYQYVKEIPGGYIIGLENKGKRKLRLKLNIAGLQLTDSMYKGRDSPTFFIEPKEKKIFNAKIKKGYTGDLSYQFETL